MQWRSMQSTYVQIYKYTCALSEPNATPDCASPETQSIGIADNVLFSGFCWLRIGCELKIRDSFR